jgi:Predicted periplasmic or secreted lipoprotein
MRGGYGGEGYDQNRWENNRGYSSYRDRDTGNYDRGYGEGRYNQGSYSQGYNYPRSTNRETYRGRDWSDYDRGQYGREQEGRYESDRGERGWWDRTSDEVASWFGDREAEQRRQMDRQRQFSGRGPKGYRRSDERIKEDVNDRLSEGYLDASEIEVAVSNSEVTLTGSVNTRQDKRRAEDIAESVSGVTHVENRLRVTQSSLDRPALGTTSATQGTNTSASLGGSTGTAGSTGNTGTSTSGTSTSAAAGGRGTSGS